MIEVKNISKQFDGYPAVQQMNMTIGDSSVFGLIGTNGSGKSTFLRMAAGVLRPDEGEILIDGALVWEEPGVKQKLFFISDDAFFFQNAAPKDMEEFYCKYYPDFDRSRFEEMLRAFGLDRGRKLRAFSKGMKKQFFIAAGLAANTKYLLCDETFDGLDPVMRQAVKSLIAQEIVDRAFTPVIASHNLRELEDICDTVGLLHEGGVLLSRDLTDMKMHIHKIQCVITDPDKESSLRKNLDLVEAHRQGSLLVITARGTREEIMQKVTEAEPLFCEIIPLSLEEIFISETEVAGYEIKNILF